MRRKNMMMGMAVLMMATLPVNSQSTGDNGFYPISFDKNQSNSNSNGRILNSISMSSSMASINIEVDNQRMYTERLEQAMIAKPGDHVTPSIGYSGTWMHGYVYLDRGQDGQFDALMNGTTIADGSDVMSFSALYDNGFIRNSNNEIKTQDGQLVQPIPFVVPSNLKDGFYRLRYKVDWDCIDPAGSTKVGNTIVKNGGAIADTRLCIRSKSTSMASLTATNGTLTLENGTPLNGATVEVGKNLKLKVNPQEGFHLERLVVKHGNLEADSLLNGVPQYVNTYFTSNDVKNGELTINGSYVDGDLEAYAEFSEGAYVPEREEYVLVFNDEFDQPDGSQPDPQKWVRSPRQTSTWNRFISTSDKVVFIDKGELVTRCIPNPDKSVDKVDMLSGAVQTAGLYDFMYGKIEARIKTNKHRGNFPAFWMMPTNQTGGWPTCGEIDIFEQIDTEDRSYHTIHSHWTYDLGKKQEPVSTGNKWVNMNDYHVYTLEWTPDLLTWLVDGIKVFSYAKSTNMTALNNGQWPFDKRFYIILNQSVGNGSWAKQADITHTYETRFDYVRVWQLKKITDGIQEVHDNTRIPTDNRIYDLQGRLVTHPQKGIYIKNGKKFVNYK